MSARSTHSDEPSTRAPGTFGILSRSGFVSPLRPDKYIRFGIAAARGVNATTGITLAAIRRPHANAIIDERGAMTWRELDDTSNALAVAFAGLGTTPPRTIGILCRNHRGIVQALAGTGRIGADALLLNTSFAGPQLADVVARENVDVLVHDEEFEGIVAHLDGIDRQPLRVLAWTDSPTDRPTVDGLIADAAGRRPPRPDRTGRIVLLTSGTTGTPKGARRPGGGNLSQLVSVLDRIPWQAEETVVVAAPIFHAWGFGQQIIATSMTCTAVLARRFDAENTLRLAAEHDATGIAVVPAMIERIVDLPDEVRAKYQLPNLRFVTASGSRMRPDAVISFMDEFGDTIYNSYNSTEAGMISIATPADLRAAPDTAGRPARGTDVRILDDDRTPVPNGEVGQVFVSNDTLFEGYTSGTTKDFNEGYIASGDLGRTDEAGRLYVVGRDDEMIVSGGENVYPLEVEKTLANHPAVFEAACIGVDDRNFGQRLIAYVVFESGSSASEADLKEHVRSELASYKVPREITVVDELPRNATGKVMKRWLLDGAPEGG